jgi:hypothetical protein
MKDEMSSEPSVALFDRYYYAHDCGRPYQRDEAWLEFFDRVARRIAEDIQPQTVLDAGCAWGFLVESLRRLGIEAYGLDVSEYAIQQVHPDVRPYCWVGSILDPLPQAYDLIVSIEVLEHMPRFDSEMAVVNICNHADEVLFSSSPTDYQEATHFNVHSPDYWVRLFARQGYFRDVDYDASYITPWAMRLRRNLTLIDDVIVPYERKLWTHLQARQEMRERLLDLERRLRQIEEEASVCERAASVNESGIWVRLIDKLRCLGSCLRPTDVERRSKQL